MQRLIFYVCFYRSLSLEQTVKLLATDIQYHYNREKTISLPLNFPKYYEQLCVNTLRKSIISVDISEIIFRPHHHRN